MAVWQMTKSGKPIAAPLYDDGDPFVPGDDGFSTAKATAQVATLGAAADGFNYVGQSASAPSL